MFKTLSNAWRIKEIRSKMIFTILMIVVYRLGNTIPIPFIDKKVVSQLMSSNAGGLVNLLDLLAGGSLKQMRCFCSKYLSLHYSINSCTTSYYCIPKTWRNCKRW